MHPRKFVRDSLGFAVAQYVVRALVMMRAIIAARLLGPLPYGAWNAIQLLMDYGTSLPPVGTQQGLDQAVPARIVDGDVPRLERLERAGLFNIVLLTTLFAAGCLVYALLRPNRFLSFWGPGWLLVAILAVLLTNLASYHMTLLRSHGNINAVSGWFFLQGTIGTVLGLALIPLVGVPGLLAGWAAGTLVATVVLRIQGRGLVPILPRPSSDGVALVRVGLPMWVFMASTQVMRSFDRLIILKFLGTLALGYYSLSVNALSFMLYLPDSISYVLYPRLLREFRHDQGRPGAIEGQVDRSLRAIAALVPAMCGIAYLCAREAVTFVLPKFTPGVPAVRTLCFGAGGLALANLSSIVLMTLGRQNVLIPAALAMTAMGATLDYLALRWGWGINGVARMTLVTYLVNGGTLLWLAYTGLRADRARRIGVVARSVAPLLASFVLAYAIDRLLPWSVTMAWPLLLLRLLAVNALFVGLYGATVAPLLQGLGLRQVMREFNLMLPWAARRPAEPL